MDVPTLQINRSELQNLINFIYKNERILHEYGAFKIQLNSDCVLALKKRRKNLVLCPTLKQIVKINEDEPLYFIERVENIEHKIEKKTAITNENQFWSSLSCSNDKQRRLNISLSQNKSFFSHKLSNLYFSIHRLPFQSLLKLGGSKVTKQIRPCVRRAHGPGAIFPLSCTEHHLFSLDYHHEGGDHHWYVIPHHQRTALQHVIAQQNLFDCLDHGKVFIDPSVLDKNEIQYYKITQQPTEFVVLSAGTLAQSFSEDSSWNESINFALPSWIQNGHANVSTTSCKCNRVQNSQLKTIDLTLFRPDRVKKYINSNLDTIPNDPSVNFHDDNNVNMVTVSTPGSNTAYSNNDEITIPTNVKIVLPRIPILPCLPSPSTPLLLSNITSCTTDDDKNQYDENNIQNEEELFSDDHFWTTLDWDIPNSTIMDTIPNEDMIEQNMPANEFCETTSLFTDTHQNFIDNSNVLALEELLNTTTPTEYNPISEHQEIEEDSPTIDSTADSSSTYTAITTITTPYRHRRRLSTRSREWNERDQSCATLFVSGLRSDIKKSDLINYFIGCVNVKIKPYQSASNLKYAFISHNTRRQAERNLRRRPNYHLLGYECVIEYATGSSRALDYERDLGNRKLVIRRIPENVSEHDLYDLFVGCQILHYSPTRIIHRSNMSNKQNNNSKYLMGYAFISYDNEEQAINVLENTDRYRIHNQPLHISVYREKTSVHTWTTRKNY